MCDRCTKENRVKLEKLQVLSSTGDFLQFNAIFFSTAIAHEKHMDASDRAR